MGVEPLGNALDGALLARLFSGKSAPLKAALLDQTSIAGLGNIYVCEALHRAGLSPRRMAGTLSARMAARPWRPAALPSSSASARGGARGGRLDTSRLSEDRRVLGYFQHRFRVYDREGDPCSRRVAAAPSSARAIGPLDLSLPEMPALSMASACAVLRRRRARRRACPVPMRHRARAKPSASKRATGRPDHPRPAGGAQRARSYHGARGDRRAGRLRS